MRAFMAQDFLLKSETAKRLYHEHAEKCHHRLPVTPSSAAAPGTANELEFMTGAVVTDKKE